MQKREGGPWVYTDRYLDRIEIDTNETPDGSVYLEIRDGSVEIKKGDLEAFIDALRETSARRPKCTRCKGSGKEPR